MHFKEDMESFPLSLCTYFVNEQDSSVTGVPADMFFADGYGSQDI